MSKSKDILIEEIQKIDPEWTREEISDVINNEPIFDAANNAIKRHAKEMIEKIAETNPEIKKALDELHQD